ncbi:hypothetical protein GCM10023183_08730 [Nibribacter koreensis]|uniref:Uncharacterized protein n=1 Tax=Nibribacter koreensis TaxID=1084519 RepID=A0ABP8FB12_9BACT
MKNEFTMQDFEKGLMLAGIVRPATLEELNHRRIVAANESFGKCPDSCNTCCQQLPECENKQLIENGREKLINNY